jgi:ribose 5-phosphate isomerase B
LRPTVTEADVLTVPAGGRLTVPAGAAITPLARDTARDRRVELVQELTPDSVTAPAPGSHPERSVAIGADHGGYGLKQDLKAYLGELGYAIVDCGTHSTASVDYPDFAYAVARQVSEGRAWRGIIVDGAGIGSCMAANKVPGVRAAMCYDHATAVNSREHNDANVLSLGGMLIGPNLARQIVKAWLETEFGGGRHARRVDKIMAIEKRFLRDYRAT